MTVNRYEGLALAVALVIVGKLFLAFVRLLAGEAP